MKVLKSIGNAFVKIWRWIKNTAWVQPLLIVGLIFGVIFSIPAITKGIQNLIANNNAANKFYTNYKLTLEGGENSAADNFINRFVETYEESQKGETEAKAAINKLPENEQRYFLYFVSTNNAAAKEAKDGFEVLRDNWTGDYAPEIASNFQLYTIYTDEETTQTKKTESAFSQFMYRRKNSNFFEDAAINARNTNYCHNGKISESEILEIGKCDPDTFKVPTLIYVEWKKGEKINTIGFKEILFTINGNNKYDKATFLKQCWDSTEDFK